MYPFGFVAIRTLKRRRKKLVHTLILFIKSTAIFIIFHLQLRLHAHSIKCIDFPTVDMIGKNEKTLKRKFMSFQFENKYPCFSFDMAMSLMPIH